MDSQLDNSDSPVEHDSDSTGEHSLWPSTPDLSQLKPPSALSTMVKLTYKTDKDGNERKIPIPQQLQHTAGLPSLKTLPEIMSIIPRFQPQPDDEPAEINIFRRPPPQPGDHVSDSDPEPSGDLIPHIASIQDSSSEHHEPKFSLFPATWPQRGTTDANPTSRQNASPSRRSDANFTEEPDFDKPSSSSRPTQKRKASTDERYLSEWAAGSSRHLRPPAERGADDSSSATQFSELNINDDSEVADDELNDRHSPRPLSVPRPRIIKRPPQTPNSDADDDPEIDPEQQDDQLSKASTSTPLKGPKKKRKVGRFKCLEPWCKETFTRRNDVTRHLKNAAVHRTRDGNQLGEGDSDKRCKFCNADLSRSDARARHERAGACGKRSVPRKGFRGEQMI